MKFSRYIIIAAGAVAALAIIAWFLRDGLIKRLSSPLLQNYGIRIVDVSLDALATSDASIGYLELVHEKGTTIAIEGLTLPFAATSKRSKTFSARKVSVITATRTEGEAFELAQLIRQVLSLPATLEDSVFIVDEFNLPPYPPIRGVRWEIVDDRQQLDGSIESVPMRATALRTEAGRYEVAFSTTAAPATAGGNMISVLLNDEDQQLSLRGDSQLHLPTWQPIARLVGIVPTELDIRSGTASVSLDVRIPSDPAQTPTLAARLSPSSALALHYQGSESGSASILVQSADNAEFSATFPKIGWSLGLAEASLAVGYADWGDIPVLVNDLSCSSGTMCSMETRTTLKNATLPVGKVAAAEFLAAGDLHFLDTGVRVELRPGATLMVRELRNEARRIGRGKVRLASTANLALADGDWRLSAESVDMEVEALSLAETTTVSMPLYLENVTIADNDNAMTVQSGVYAPSSRATLGETTIALPGVKGQVSLEGDTVTAELETVGLGREGSIKARHNLDSAIGNASVDGATVSFGTKSLSDRISPFPDDRDIVAGTVSVSMSANWVQEKAHAELSGHAVVAAKELAGYFGDTAFTGVSTEFSAGYRHGDGFNSDPSTITAALVEVGVPVENLSASYELDLNALSADIDDLRMSAFGGVVTAEPFSFHTERPVNNLILNAESLDLTSLLSLEGFEAVDVTGSVNVRLPLAIEDNTVTIVNGAITGNPPGGLIRYHSDGPPDALNTSSWDFVKRVLNNLEFETLTSDVNLSKTGDLIMQVQLKGRNPDLDEKRPVVLNLGVENNIPQMIRSLRAARAVEDILEKRLSR